MFCLKAIRLENGMKRSELSRLMGIHANTLANYENEEREAPYEMLIRFADFFGVTTDELLGREQSTAASPALPTARERRLLARYRALGEGDRRRLEDILAVLEQNAREER